MESWGKVRVQSLAEAISEKLRDAIIRGELAPGDRLIEQKLARAFGTSQPTVREALRDLESQGFVRKIANKGTYVTELTQRDIGKIMEVRITLEQLAVTRAAEKMTPEAARTLSSLVDEMEFAVADLDRARFHNADLSFHRAIWELADNEYLALALARTIFSLFAFVLSTQGQQELEKAVEQHRFILSGVLSGNGGQARDMFTKATEDFWIKHSHIGLKKDGARECN